MLYSRTRWRDRRSEFGTARRVEKQSLAAPGCTSKFYMALFCSVCSELSFSQSIIILIIICIRTSIYSNRFALSQHGHRGQRTQRHPSVARAQGVSARLHSAQLLTRSTLHSLFPWLCSHFLVGHFIWVNKYLVHQCMVYDSVLALTNKLNWRFWVFSKRGTLRLSTILWLFTILNWTNLIIYSK